MQVPRLPQNSQAIDVTPVIVTNEPVSKKSINATVDDNIAPRREVAPFCVLVVPKMTEVDPSSDIKDEPPFDLFHPPTVDNNAIRILETKVPVSMPYGSREIVDHNQLDGAATVLESNDSELDGSGNITADQYGQPGIEYLSQEQIEFARLQTASNFFQSLDPSLPNFENSDEMQPQLPISFSSLSNYFNSQEHRNLKPSSPLKPNPYAYTGWKNDYKVVKPTKKGSNIIIMDPKKLSDVLSSDFNMEDVVKNREEEEELFTADPNWGSLFPDMGDVMNDPLYLPGRDEFPQNDRYELRIDRPIEEFEHEEGEDTVKDEQDDNNFFLTPRGKEISEGKTNIEVSDEKKGCINFKPNRNVQIKDLPESAEQHPTTRQYECIPSVKEIGPRRAPSRRHGGSYQPYRRPHARYKGNGYRDFVSHPEEKYIPANTMPGRDDQHRNVIPCDYGENGGQHISSNGRSSPVGHDEQPQTQQEPFIFRFDAYESVGKLFRSFIEENQGAMAACCQKMVNLGTFIGPDVDFWKEVGEEMRHDQEQNDFMQLAQGSNGAPSGSTRTRRRTRTVKKE